MAVPAKLLHVAALLAKAESTYGTAATLTASSDGVQMQFDQPNSTAVFETKYSNDGDIGSSMASLGAVARVAPAGRYAEGTIPALMRMPASAYSATVLPGLHRLTLASGFDAAIVTSAGAETVTYTPTSYGTGYTSLTMKAYTRGEVQTLTGALCDLSIDAKDGKPPKWSFATKAIAGLPSDASPVLPSGLVFPNQAVAPLPNVGTVVHFGDYVTPIVKSWSFAMNRALDPRINYAGTNAHAGFVPGMRKPQFKFVIEATALQTTPFHNSSGFDPYSLLDVGTVISTGANVTVGSVQYNKWQVVFGAGAQVIDVKPVNEAAVATFEITILGITSTPTANDDVYISCT